MSYIKKLFLLQCAEAEKLFISSMKEKNPALFLYTNQLRTTMFKMQSLARIVNKMKETDAHKSVLESVKSIEDLLGRIDYYDAFHKQFKSNTTLPRSIKVKNENDYNIAFIDFQKVLNKEKWLIQPIVPLQKIKSVIESMPEIEYEKELNLLKHFFEIEIFKTNKQILKRKNKLEDLELDVHELRRKIRWLSIYAQSLGGMIQLNENEEVDKNIKKYLTKDILKSPFNVLPKNEKLSSAIYLSKNHFFALSWIIDYLGKEKDLGGSIHWMTHSFRKVELQNKETAAHKTKLILKQDDDIAMILKRCSNILNKFSEDKILDQLVVGISSQKKK